MHIVQYFHGSSAEGLLENPAFLAAWEGLELRCRHSTCFQSPAYVRTWYRHYRDAFQPVILLTRAPSGELVGLWLLAFNPSTRELIHAGGHQAEYHVWLTLPGEDVAFLVFAWMELRRRLPFRTLRFRYLPLRSLVEALRSSHNIRPCMSSRTWPKPVLRLDPAEVRASLALKKNKARFSRIRKLGDLEFRRIRTSAELNEVFDDIIAFYDLRQGAVNDATPFGSDPARKSFHLALLDLAPDMMHVTVTYLNGRVIAAFLGLITG